MVALGARAELMKGELLRDRREAAEEEDDDHEEQAVAATPSPKKRSRRRDRRRAAEALTGDASTKIGRWWLGLKIRWLLGERDKEHPLQFLEPGRDQAKF